MITLDIKAKIENDVYDLLKDINYEENDKLNPYKKYAVYPEEYVYIKNNDMFMLIEADIAAAFPTFVNLYFKEKYPHLVEEINQLTDKRARNIKIATTLTHDELVLLNVLSKAYIIHIVSKHFYLYDIIEFKKDGGLFIVLNDGYISNNITVNNVTVNIRKVDSYMHFNNTSLYWYNNDFKIKGKLKHVPEYIYNIYLHKFDNLYELTSQYDDNLYKIELYTNNYDLIRFKYITTSNKILLNNKFVDFTDYNQLYNINTREYYMTYLYMYLKLLLSI